MRPKLHSKIRETFFAKYFFGIQSVIKAQNTTSQSTIDELNALRNELFVNTFTTGSVLTGNVLTGNILTGNILTGNFNT
jgi:hypothetical protein